MTVVFLVLIYILVAIIGAIAWLSITACKGLIDDTRTMRATIDDLKGIVDDQSKKITDLTGELSDLYTLYIEVKERQESDKYDMISVNNMLATLHSRVNSMETRNMYVTTATTNQAEKEVFNVEG